MSYLKSITLWQALPYGVAALNLIALLLMGWDKWQATRHRNRVPERTLMLWALAGGSVGALCGMLLFRHKTRHLKFALGLPLILMLHIGLAVWLFTL